MKKVLISMATLISTIILGQASVFASETNDPTIYHLVVDGIGEYYYSEETEKHYVMCTGVGTCITADRNSDGTYTITLHTKDGPCTLSGTFDQDMKETMPQGNYSISSK